MSCVGVFSWRIKGRLSPFYHACSIKGIDTRYKWRNLESKARGAPTAFFTLLQLHMLTAVNSRSDSQINVPLSSLNVRGVALHNGMQ